MNNFQPSKSPFVITATISSCSFLSTDIYVFAMKSSYPSPQLFPTNLCSEMPHACLLSQSFLGAGFECSLFSAHLGKIPIFTNIAQMGWNHQLVSRAFFIFFIFGLGGIASQEPGRVSNSKLQSTPSFMEGIGSIVLNNFFFRVLRTLFI